MIEELCRDLFPFESVLSWKALLAKAPSGSGHNRGLPHRSGGLSLGDWHQVKAAEGLMAKGAQVLLMRAIASAWSAICCC